MRRRWNHNLHYHCLVLRSVPSPCPRALDVGCGEAVLTRELAARCGEVTGLDLDPAVLHGADGTSPPNVRLVAGDVLTYPFPAAHFDFIAAMAALHHLPLQQGLERLRDLLRPNGVLAIIGLYRPSTAMDRVAAAAAWPVSCVLRHVHEPVRMQASVREPNETLQEVRNAAEALLPGVVIERRFFFRYSLLWRKPG